MKASALSFALLLLSRLFGLVRESAQAAAFGTTGMADVAVLMLTLPDWLTNVLVSGALAYVLLPEWATQSSTERAQTQGRVARFLLGLGVLGTTVLYVFQDATVHLLANGLPSHLVPQARQGLVWAACALPVALLSVLWLTRLQHERDFIGVYASNLVVNTVLILAYWLVFATDPGSNTVSLLGLFLGLAMGLRLLWFHWRLRRFAVEPAPRTGKTTHPLPHARLWLWASLSAGLPLAIPFAARSFASTSGEGGLATFNYAWKLVELPLVLAIQLVATVAFPSIAQAMSSRELESMPANSQALPAAAIRAVRGAFLLAWTLACAAVSALQVAAPAIVTLLFGWGRMPVDGLVKVAAWGRMGSWSLLPQALIAVALTVLATQGRMHTAVAAYLLALTGLLAFGVWFQGDGADLMVAINTVLCIVAIVALMDLRRKGQAQPDRQSLLPWQAMAVPALVLTGITVAARQLEGSGPTIHVGIYPISYCFLAASSVIAISYLASAELRSALRR